MSLFSVLSVSASGMAAQRTRAELLVENLANAETTRTPEGGPYKKEGRRLHQFGAELPVFSGLPNRNGLGSKWRGRRRGCGGHA